MKILVEKEEFRGYPEDVKLLLAIALYEVTPYSWDKIAEILGFTPILLRGRLKAFNIPLHKYTELEMRGERRSSQQPRSHSSLRLKG
jgi:predicted HTH domain antitoxin